MQSIRDNNISGTSCTIVLCGAHTHGRKYVDWELKGTLDKEHGLIGVQLPSVARATDGKSIVPTRLHNNIVSGYALWITWDQLMGGANALKGYIEDALDTARRPKRLIVNGRDMMRRNTAP
ncbi:MAG TPA: TIR domain-containing protein [Terriglobales bacterium]|nr:TIR domain-containing protein [Terriglobales bacterium]